MRTTWILSLLVALAVQNIRADVVDQVDPFIGTAILNDQGLMGGGRGGNVHPGAAYPFGMVLWSPETPRVDSGVYEYTKKEITGFSLTHLSGPGCVAAGEFPILPATDPNAKTLAYSHRDETASPGYYALTLDNGIHLQLSVTARTGMGLFNFPNGGHLILDAGHTSLTKLNAHVEKVSDTEISGWAEGGFFCGSKNKTLVNFVLQTKVPFQYQDLGEGKVRLSFSGSQEVPVKVGLSYVSVAGARKNLMQENPGWDFLSVKQAARDTWAKYLAKIEVKSNDPTREKIFYTALYHTLLHPNIISDVAQNGAANYPGFSESPAFADYKGALPSPRVASNYTQYANFSGWDIYRSQSQFLAWLYPKEANDMMKSYVSEAREGGGAFPRWAEYNNETAVMNGDPAAGIVAGSYAFGATDFPTAEALGYLRHSGLDPNATSERYYSRPGLTEYMNLGFIPFELKSVWGSVSTALEYAVADYAVGQFAKALGDNKLYSFFDQRSRSWKNNFDVTTGLPRPRHADGSWLEKFNPTSRDGYTEGNAFQYAWFVPHDARALVAWMGGDDIAIARLDDHLSHLNAGPDSPYFYVGNEPSFHTPWLYNWTTKPSHTQDHIRRIMNESFNATRTGLPGNDDLGATSSWYVWSALGLFPAVPGESRLALSSPVFDEVKVQLPSGEVLNIQSADSTKVYIQKVQVVLANAGGKNSTAVLNSPWLPSSMVFHGGVLKYELGDQPNDSIWVDPKFR